MNKIYSKVWSKSQGRLVVASELANSDSAGASAASARVSFFTQRVLVAAVMFALGGFAGSALAADAVCVDPVTGLPVGNVTAAGDQIACGQGAVASGTNTVAIGANARAINARSISIGQNTGTAQAFTGTITSNPNIAIGDTAGTNTSLAASSMQEGGNVALGVNVGNTVAGYNNTAIGTGGTGNNIANGWGNVAIGWGTGTNLGGNSVNNVALGSGAGTGVTGSSNVALGNGAGRGITAISTVSIGSTSKASATSAVAIGNEALASGGESTAMGFRSNASGTQGTAVGNYAKASSTQAAAFGSFANASGGQSVALGTSAASAGSRAAAVGYLAQATGASSIAFGNGAQAKGESSISIGTGNIVNGARSGAIGDPSIINGTDSYSVGNNNSIAAGAGDVFVLGNNVNIGVVSDVVALGSNSNVAYANGVALGAGSQAVRDVSNETAYVPPRATTVAGADAAGGEISVGAVGAERRTTNVAAGAQDTDAVNVSQLKAAQTHYYSVNDNGVISGNYNNDGATGPGSLAAGANATASGTLSTAIGNGTTALGSYSVSVGQGSTSVFNATAIGSGAQALGGWSVALGDLASTARNGDVAIGNEAAASGQDALSMMAFSKAFGRRSIAVGYGASTGSALSADNMADFGAIAIGGNSHAEGVFSNAFGYASSASVGQSAAFGFASAALARNALALGTSATAALENGVALGSNSRADTDAFAYGYDPATGTASTDTSPTWLSTHAAVSVGDVERGITRQITNVAAGTKDTDAVNVAQLKAVQATANAGWNVSAQGANATNVAPDSPTGSDVDMNNSDGNIVVSKAADSNDVTFDLNKDIDLGSDGSVTIGDTVINGDSIATNNMTVGGVTQLGDNFVVNNDGSVHYNGPITEDDHIVNKDYVDNTVNDVVEANKTRYYSVNSTGGGNEDNDGATGEDAIASGKDAQASAAQAIALGMGAQASVINSVALGAGSATSAAVATTSGSINGTTYNYAGAAPVGVVSVGAAGAERQVQNVAAGQVSTTSTDAVNGSQLHATNTAIEALDGRVSNFEGDIVDIQGDIVDIQGDITDLDDRVSTVEGDVANLTTTVNQFENRASTVENGADGMFQVSQEGPIVKPTPTGENSLAGGNGAVASGDNSTAVGNQSVASGDNSTALGQSATATHNNSVALGAGSATTVGAQSGYNAAYVGSSSSVGEVNVGNRTISGVAPGIAGTDAVNLNQLNSGVNYAIDQANQYTDNRFNQLQNDVWMANDELRRDMYSGVASALAAKQAPWVPGKTSYYAGMAGYRGQGALGISLRRTADNGRWSLEGGFTKDRGGSGAFVGVSGVLGD